MTVQETVLAFGCWLCMHLCLFLRCSCRCCSTVSRQHSSTNRCWRCRPSWLGLTQCCFCGWRYRGPGLTWRASSWALKTFNTSCRRRHISSTPLIRTLRYAWLHVMYTDYWCAACKVRDVLHAFCKGLPNIEEIQNRKYMGLCIYFFFLVKLILRCWDVKVLYWNTWNVLCNKTRRCFSVQITNLLLYIRMPEHGAIYILSS